MAVIQNESSSCLVCVGGFCCFQPVKCHGIVLICSGSVNLIVLLCKMTQVVHLQIVQEMCMQEHSCWNGLLISLSLLQSFIHWVFILGKGRAKSMQYKALITLQGSLALHEIFLLLNLLFLYKVLWNLRILLKKENRKYCLAAAAA